MVGRGQKWRPPCLQWAGASGSDVLLAELGGLGWGGDRATSQQSSTKTGGSCHFTKRWLPATKERLK